MEKKSIHQSTSTPCKAPTLTMGGPATVLSCLDKLEAQSAVVLLGLGLACAGIAMLEK